VDQAVTAVLGEYHARMEREEPLQQRLAGTAEYDMRREEFLLCIGPETGQLLNLLVKSARAQVVVEIGASYGYSTVWLAEAARTTGGRVYSLEIAPAKVEYGRQMLRKAGLESGVEALSGDAIATLGSFPHGVDFALIDLWKPLYVATLEALYPRLNPGALIAADNILWPERYRQYSAQYLAALRAKPGLETVTIPIGDGIELTRFSG
jgi:predicted O-methyltransferase YrrM